ncbi:MAG: hypothetical protein O3A13_14580 [Proteobacteria bacterium]|nr:hypothetical protein [Pseudomonadota bacterium]
MWIPGPIYESLPYAYIFAGVLFISGTLYVGLDTPGAPLYIACGLISIISGAFVFGWRQAHRRKSSKHGNTSAA